MVNQIPTGFQLEKQYVEWVRDIRGMRFELSDSLVEEGAGSRQQAELDICKILDVDGEVIALSAPKFDVRYCSALSLCLSLCLCLSLSLTSPFTFLLNTSLDPCMNLGPINW